MELLDTGKIQKCINRRINHNFVDFMNVTRRSLQAEVPIRLSEHLDYTNASARFGPSPIVASVPQTLSLEVGGYWVSARALPSTGHYLGDISGVLTPVSRGAIYASRQGGSISLTVDDDVPRSEVNLVGLVIERRHQGTVTDMYVFDGRNTEIVGRVALLVPDETIGLEVALSEIQTKAARIAAWAQRAGDVSVQSVVENIQEIEMVASEALRGAGSTLYSSVKAVQRKVKSTGPMPASVIRDEPGSTGLGVDDGFG